jgi:uncharacterized membrane protein
MTQKSTQRTGNSQNNSLRERLTKEAGDLAAAAGGLALSTAQRVVNDATGRLSDYADSGAAAGLKTAATGAFEIVKGKTPAPVRAGLSDLTEKTGLKKAASLLGGEGLGGGDGQGPGGKGLKVTNIEESVDIGAPVSVVYNQWTQFTDFPGFMKKVEKVEQPEDTKLKWRAQILWSHREWESTVLEQVPDEKIIWRSEGQKGHADGAVTFHQLAPNLTRVLVTLEYYPQGFFEHTGNLWRAQGRRVRLELKHFRRHVMSEVLQHPREVKGKREVVKDGKVTPDRKTAASKRGNGARTRTTRGRDQSKAPAASRQRRSASQTAAARRES